MGIPGEDSPKIIDGLSFLKQVNEGQSPAIGRKVIVVGGGNTAVDAARAVGCSVAQIVKSLVFVVDGEPVEHRKRMGQQRLADVEARVAIGLDEDRLDAFAGEDQAGGAPRRPVIASAGAVSARHGPHVDHGVGCRGGSAGKKNRRAADVRVAANRHRRHAHGGSPASSCAALSGMLAVRSFISVRSASRS